MLSRTPLLLSLVHDPSIETTCPFESLGSGGREYTEPAHQFFSVLPLVRSSLKSESIKAGPGNPPLSGIYAHERTPSPPNCSKPLATHKAVKLFMRNARCIVFDYKTTSSLTNSGWLMMRDVPAEPNVCPLDSRSPLRDRPLRFCGFEVQ